MDELLAALRGAGRVAMVSHRDPDPDTVGSALALGMALESLGTRVTYHCADPVPEGIRFLAGSERYVSDPPAADVDLICALDFGDPSRARFTLPPNVPVANIDHHVSSGGFGATRLVDPTSAATGELVGRVIDGLGVRWTPEMATALLVAIMTDTGSFQFPNTDGRVLRLAAELRERGADLQTITFSVFRNRRFEALRLWGTGFSRLVREEHGLLVWTWIDQADVAAAEAREEDVSGLVEQVARSSGMRLALLFHGQNGAVKVSCRTSDAAPSVDAAELMGRHGGGGHMRAAGALVAGDPRAVRERVLADARDALARARLRSTA